LDVQRRPEEGDERGREASEPHNLGRFSTLAAIAAAILLPASAGATTVGLGPPELGSSPVPELKCEAPCTGGKTLAQLVSPAVVWEAPAAGLVTSWQARGSGSLRLRVLRPGPEGRWLGDGTSAPASGTGERNASSLPIRAGDVIGVDIPDVSSRIAYFEPAPTDHSELLEWSPALADNGVALEAAYPPDTNLEILFNADVVLAPVLSSLSPASGSTAGGNAVKISGRYLDGASGVTFGSTPASSFSVDSFGQITAIAPPSTASTVDVRVSGPGGSSEVGSGDRYTFGGASTTTGTGGPALQPVKPTVTGFSESSSRWRRGRSLPHISSASGAPVGTTFSFGLNEPASVNLTFTQSGPGRLLAGRCVAPGHGNARRPRCKRPLLVGSFTVPGHAGLDSVRFGGRLSGSRTLKPGSYLVSLTARAGHGPKVFSRSLRFTIIS
jgi:hypothetical protein